MTEFTKEFITNWKHAIKVVVSVRGDMREIEKFALEALDEIERLQQRIAELEQEQRWIPVRDYPSQVGWYRVITNNGTEQIREYVRGPDRDIHYWDVKDGEWIMMYTNPPLPQPPQEGE